MQEPVSRSYVPWSEQPGRHWYTCWSTMLQSSPCQPALQKHWPDTHVPWPEQEWSIQSSVHEKKRKKLIMVSIGTDRRECWDGTYHHHHISTKVCEGRKYLYDYITLRWFWNKLINYDQVVASDTISKNLIQSRDNCNMHRVSSTGTNAGSRALPFDAGETNVSGIGHLQSSMSEFRCDLPGCGQAANSPKLNTCTGACLKLMLSFSYIFVL